MYKVVKGLRWYDGVELEDGTIIFVNKSNSNSVNVVIVRDTEIGKINIVKREEAEDDEFKSGTGYRNSVE